MIIAIYNITVLSIELYKHESQLVNFFLTENNSELQRVLLCSLWDCHCS